MISQVLSVSDITSYSKSPSVAAAAGRAVKGIAVKISVKVKINAKICVSFDFFHS